MHFISTPFLFIICLLKHLSKINLFEILKLFTRSILVSGSLSCISRSEAVPSWKSWKSPFFDASSYNNQPWRNPSQSLVALPHSPQPDKKDAMKKYEEIWRSYFCHLLPGAVLLLESQSCLLLLLPGVDVPPGVQELVVDEEEGAADNVAEEGGEDAKEEELNVWIKFRGW